MFPNDNQAQEPADNTTFSGSSLGDTTAASLVTDPYNSSSSTAAPNSPVAAPSTDPATLAPASDTTDQNLNDFLSDSNGPSFLDDKPAASSAPQVDGNQGDSSAASTPAAADSSELAAMKQQALTQLQPLVDHLDQTAEEQFKTTMMLIQATDDQSLIKKAFDAAQKIEDDKVRAQALLDIINEINYFTHTADSEDNK